MHEVFLVWIIKRFTEHNEFSLIGASGYIASRHIDAIYNLGGNIVSYHDINRNDELEKKELLSLSLRKHF